MSLDVDLVCMFCVQYTIKLRNDAQWHRSIELLRILLVFQIHVTLQKLKFLLTVIRINCNYVNLLEIVIHLQIARDSGILYKIAGGPDGQLVASQKRGPRPGPKAVLPIPDVLCVRSLSLSLYIEPRKRKKIYINL